MLAYTVKLSSEQVRLKQETAEVKALNATLKRENERLSKALAKAEVELESDTTSHDEESIEEKWPSEAGLETSRLHSNLAEQKSLPTNTPILTGVQLWQLFLVAAICFVLGRML